MITPKFSGLPKVEWLADGRTVKLEEDFSFTDKSGKVWIAKKGRIVDGSSIPRVFWSMIGSPFVGLHRFASIIHDVYCVDKNEPHQAVHQMYFDACLCAGVNKTKAKLMYSAVKLGGPTWD